MVGLLFGAGALLLLGAGIVLRWRIRRALRRGPPEVTDDIVRRIEEEGFVPSDDPGRLDEEAARREEERFWGETWDRPEDPWE